MAKKLGEDQSRKICLKRGLGPTPEDPVCDSGIFCYGKFFFFYFFFTGKLKKWENITRTKCLSEWLQECKDYFKGF